MHRECRGPFPRHQLQRKPTVSDPDMHLRDARAVIHVGIATPGGGENVPSIPGVCAILNDTYLARGPCLVSMCPRAKESKIKLILLYDLSELRP